MLSGTAIAVPASQMRPKCRRHSARPRGADAAQRDQLEVLAPEQEAVDQPEDEGRERRDREVDASAASVRRDDEAEEAQRVAELAGEPERRAGGSAG